MSYINNYFIKLLAGAGVVVNGPMPWDIQVHNEKLYRQVLLKGTLGLGEAYMDGWWTCKSVDQFFYRVIKAGLEKNVKHSFPFFASLVNSFFRNLQSTARAFQVGEKHYDIGNDLYSRMLGETLAYSCAYWDGAETLDAAQKAKLDLICRKINLKNGEKVLDIGCGWGSFLKFAAENYEASLTGITISKEQASYANQKCSGLPVAIKLMDYRDLSGNFDHVISIGMFEHVGYKNYRQFMEVVDRCLKDGGLFLLHTIGRNESTTTNEPWLDKYIFPNGMIPALDQIAKAVEGLFVIEDVHNFGPDYDKTLMVWYENFKKSWPEIRGKYGDRFLKMWEYYLLSCAGSFRARKNQLWQIVLSKKVNNYKPVR